MAYVPIEEIMEFVREYTIEKFPDIQDKVLDMLLNHFEFKYHAAALAGEILISYRVTFGRQFI